MEANFLLMLAGQLEEGGEKTRPPHRYFILFIYLFIFDSFIVTE